jgi:DNA polymerase
VVFLDTDARAETVIIDDRDALEAFYDEHKHDIFTGYNSRQYDVYIFKAILCDFDPYDVSNFIITQGNPGWRYSGLFRKITINNYDVMTNIDHGLKKLEGFMGNDIRETSVPFDIDRPLTPEELQETVKYCRHDVEQTIEVFLQRKDDFEAHMGLVRLASGSGGLDLSLINLTNPQLSARILGAEKRNRYDEFDIDLPPTLRVEKYTAAPEWYSSPESRRYSNGDEKNQFIITVAGVPHSFGYGGVHGAREKYHERGFFLNMDVTSLYPSLMIEYDLGSRSMKHPERFEEIYEQRLKYKREKNPLQAPLKLVLNSAYGVMKEPTNPLYDPRQSNRVCVYGQLLLLDLIERLEPHGTLVQSNTDGVLLRMPESAEPDAWYALIDDVAYEWERRTRLKLEFEEFCEVWQKDVNNYVMIKPDGSYKSKGAYTKKLSALDYDLAIINRAMVDFMVRGTPVERTVNDCNDLRDFQLIAKASGKFLHIKHGNRRLKEKCIRVFASRDYRDGGVVKVHATRGTTIKIPNSPERCFIDNGDVKGVAPPDKLDRQFYIDLAENRLRDFGVATERNYTFL